MRVEAVWTVGLVFLLVLGSSSPVPEEEEDEDESACDAAYCDASVGTRGEAVVRWSGHDGSG